MLFGAVKLTKNDLDKYSYLRYGIVFDFLPLLWILNFDVDKNGITFDYLVHLCILIIKKTVFGEGPMQVLDHTTITTEAKYLVNFTPSKKPLFESALQ